MGLVPVLVLGLTVGNLIVGLPFQLDADLRSTYSGGFWDLFSPFALLTAVIAIALCCLHGAVFLQWRTEGDLAERSKRIIRWSTIIFALSFMLAGFWIAFGIEGYRITQLMDTSHALNPLTKTVEKAVGAWLDNYQHYPLLIIAPVTALLGCALNIKLS